MLPSGSPNCGTYHERGAADRKPVRSPSYRCPPSSRRLAGACHYGLLLRPLPCRSIQIFNRGVNSKTGTSPKSNEGTQAHLHARLAPPKDASRDRSADWQNLSKVGFFIDVHRIAGHSAGRPQRPWARRGRAAWGASLRSRPSLPKRRALGLCVEPALANARSGSPQCPAAASQWTP